MKNIYITYTCACIGSKTIHALLEAHVLVFLYMRFVIQSACIRLEIHALHRLKNACIATPLHALFKAHVKPFPARPLPALLKRM